MQFTSAYPYPKSGKVIVRSIERDESEYYGPLDFMVGSIVEVLHKSMIIYDCDDYTSEYYKKKYGIEMERNADYEALLNKVKPKSTLVKPPPHTITSVGTPEDSMQNCLSLQPKAPRRDLKKLLHYAGKVLFTFILFILITFFNLKRLSIF